MNNCKYIDIHSHLNLSPLLNDNQNVISRMRENQVATITVGVDFETSKKAIEIAGQNPGFTHATVGLHPSDVEKENFDFMQFETLAMDPNVVAVGECGLDYYRKNDDEFKAKQKEIFKKHIELAQKINKPLMIHARASKGSMDAYEDAIEILENTTSVLSDISPLSRGRNLNADFHFFAGNLEIAQRIVKNGWSISFDGPITFARDYDEVIKNIPLENIMCETDAPFAAPEPYRGKTCEPWMVIEVYKKIAEIKEMDLEEVRIKINENAVKFFKLN